MCPWGVQTPSAVPFAAFGVACVRCSLWFSDFFPISQPSCYLWSFPSCWLRQTWMLQIDWRSGLGTLSCVLQAGRQPRRRLCLSGLCCQALGQPVLPLTLRTCTWVLVVLGSTGAGGR